MAIYEIEFELLEGLTMNRRLLILLCAAMSSCSTCPAGVVADTMFKECRGESLEGQKAVASVIWNRAKESGKSLEAVCLARRQFSCWNNGYTPVKPRNGQERAILARFEAIEADMKAGTFKPSGTWTHYYAFRVCNPKWAKGLKNVKTIGSHRFGRINCDKIVWRVGK